MAFRKKFPVLFVKTSAVTYGIDFLDGFHYGLIVAISVGCWTVVAGVATALRAVQCSL